MNKKSYTPKSEPARATAPQRKRGRPPSRIRRTRYQISIEPRLADTLTDLGNGSLSAGIERAAEKLTASQSH